MRRFPAILLLAAGCAAADEDPIAVLMRLRDQVLAHGERIPNHTCVETVERARYNATREQLKSCDAILARRQHADFAGLLRLSTTDRLRLDVALAWDREIYSWARASKFEEGEIDELIPEGAMGTGPFASLLLSVFTDRTPKFVFDGDTSVAGRALYEYSFRVAREDSHYRYKTHGQWIITGYTGELLVDPQTAELVRLTVRTEELPRETASCEVDTEMEYGKVRLTGVDFLLPKATRQRFIGRDGSESENGYAFSSCRDFLAESSVAFGEARPGAGEAKGSRAAPSPPWPAALPVSIDTVAAIDSSTAAAGDRIEGRVAAPIRLPDKTVLAPQGTPVAGRLMRVEVRHTSPPQLTIALRWETVELDGVQAPLYLTPGRQAKPGIQAGGLAGLAGLRSRGMEFELPLPGEERYGVFHFPGGRRVVEKGLRSEWLTARP